MSNQLKMSATNSKLGVRKLSIDTVRLYPRARNISVNCRSSRNDILCSDGRRTECSQWADKVPLQWSRSPAIASSDFSMQHRGVSPQARTKLAAANHLQSTGILAIAAAALAAAPRTRACVFHFRRRFSKKVGPPSLVEKRAEKWWKVGNTSAEFLELKHSFILEGGCLTS